LHHFFEAQVRNKLGSIENVFEQRTCPSKKRDRLLPQPPFLFQLKRKNRYLGASMEKFLHIKKVAVDVLGRMLFFGGRSYNEIGQLVTKKLHSTNNGSTFKQHVDYRYNIRGWMTRINNSDLTPDNTNDPRDHFGINLHYNDVVSGINNTPQFNGNISATKYSTNQGFDMGLKERAYKYDYDAMSRLTAATHYQKATGWNMSGGLHEDNITYDLNTKILSVRRKDASGSQMDNLVFDYGTGNASGNQLRKVTDSGDTQKGFTDGNIVGDDYTYDANGNRITDKNKGITAYRYNYMNQREKVTFSNGSYLLYTYDAVGNKLSQGVYNSANVLQKKTDYVGEFFYENDTLKYISTEEGRYNTLANAYEYELRDHLGNNRVTFTTKAEQDQATATVETADLTAEQGKFLRYANARRISSHLFDKTNGSAPTTTPGYAVRLNGSANEKFGLARSLAVMPGDTVKAEVYVKYIDTNSTNWTGALNTLLTQIASGTAAAGTVIDGANYATSTSSFNYAGLLNTSASTGTGPKAYLNWLVFDQNFALVNGGYVRMTDAAKEYGQDVMHEKLSAEIPIITSGFVYVYLSNENESVVEVYYDQFAVALRKSPVIDATDLYPYGAPALSSTREFSLKQNKLLNGKETQDELGYNVVDLGQRDIDPFVPVFPTIDRFAEKYYSISPYQYTGGNPVAFVDINGDSLWINYKGNNVLYQNGGLYNKDGTAYAGAGAKKDKSGNVVGYKGFLGQAFNSLNQISSAEGQAGTSVVSELQSSSNNFTITDAANNPRGAGQNEFVSDNKSGEYAIAMLDAGQGRPQAGGSGGTVYWNPSSTSPLNGVSEFGGGTGIRPTTNLAHELFHGYDSNRGLGDNRPVNGLKRSEWRAAYFENQMRLQMGLPFRESYNLRTGPVHILTPVTIFNSTIHLPTPVSPPSIGWLQYLRFR
jgi:RHS repeat-associated protein